MSGWSSQTPISGWNTQANDWNTQDNDWNTQANDCNPQANARPCDSWGGGASADANLEQIRTNYFDRLTVIKEDPVIVCIDLEAHCRNQTHAEFQAGVKTKQRRICELGFAVIDSRNLRDNEPNDRYQGVWGKITAFNLVPVGNEHRLTKGQDHCRVPWCGVGDAKQFRFGHPQYVPKTELKGSFIETIRSFLQDGEGEVERPVLFVIFSMSQDVKWLREAGINLRTDFANSTLLDIQRSPVATIAAEGKQQCSASDLCYYFGNASCGCPQRRKRRGL